MRELSVKGLDTQTINETIRAAEDGLLLSDCLGQRCLACGSSGRRVVLRGTPGNALGAYLDGSVLEIQGNVQDAVGDTMNDGRILVHGSAGDAVGYAMRGGAILIKGDAGYRAGIHMKEYREKRPMLIIGGRAGSFLGEYQAGGVIAVLGLGAEGSGPPVGRFCATGMHGGRILLRGSEAPPDLPPQVRAEPAEEGDLEELAPLLKEFCAAFGGAVEELIDAGFLVLRPDSGNPYQRLYTPI